MHKLLCVSRLRLGLGWRRRLTLDAHAAVFPGPGQVGRPDERAAQAGAQHAGAPPLDVDGEAALPQQQAHRLALLDPLRLAAGPGRVVVAVPVHSGVAVVHPAVRALHAWFNVRSQSQCSLLLILVALVFPAEQSVA